MGVRRGASWLRAAVLLGALAPGLNQHDTWAMPGDTLSVHGLVFAAPAGGPGGGFAWVPVDNTGADVLTALGRGVWRASVSWEGQHVADFTWVEPTTLAAEVQTACSATVEAAGKSGAAALDPRKCATVAALGARTLQMWQVAELAIASDASSILSSRSDGVRATAALLEELSAAFRRTEAWSGPGFSRDCFSTGWKASTNETFQHDGHCLPLLDRSLADIYWSMDLVERGKYAMQRAFAGLRRLRTAAPGCICNRMEMITNKQSGQQGLCLEAGHMSLRDVAFGHPIAFDMPDSTLVRNTIVSDACHEELLFVSRTIGEYIRHVIRRVPQYAGFKDVGLGTHVMQAVVDQYASFQERHGSLLRNSTRPGVAFNYMIEANIIMGMFQLGRTAAANRSIERLSEVQPDIQNLPMSRIRYALLKGASDEDKSAALASMRSRFQEALDSGSPDYQFMALSGMLKTFTCTPLKKTLDDKITSHLVYKGSARNRATAFATSSVTRASERDISPAVSFYSGGYVLPAECPLLIADIDGGARTKWVFKVRDGADGQGTVFLSADEALARCNRDSDDYTSSVVLAMRYVPTPLLIDGRKSEIRVMVFVEDVYEDAQLRRRPVLHLYDRPTVVKISANKYGQSLAEGNDFTNARQGGEVVARDRLEGAVAAVRPDGWEVLWDRISHLVLASFEAGLRLDDLMHCEMSFIVYDIIVDQTLHPWIIETGVAPGFGVGTTDPAELLVDIEGLLNHAHDPSVSSSSAEGCYLRGRPDERVSRYRFTMIAC